MTVAHLVASRAISNSDMSFGKTCCHCESTTAPAAVHSAGAPVLSTARPNAAWCAVNLAEDALKKVALLKNGHVG